ncbi:MAG: glycosyltransferase family 4 protein [Thermoplasmatales archaeon]
MHRTQKVYDFVFVLPGFDRKPPGGYMVVFELAEDLQTNGYTVLIIFLRSLYTNLYRSTHDSNILEKHRSIGLMTIFFDRMTLFITQKNLCYFLSFMKKLGYDVNMSAFSFQKNSKFVVKDNIPDTIIIKRLIATAWETAYFVNEYRHDVLKYYLVQNNEDDISFSGTLSYAATKTYSFPLKKIVINAITQNRFASDKPIKITVAPHVKAKLKVNPEDRSRCIAIQLRNGEDKGAKYGIEAMKIIHERHNDIKIESYGNYSGEIPDFIVHHGFMPEAEYIDLFNRSIIFILPSLIEGFSAPVLESMICGCVPVVTDCEGPAEMIENKFNGIIVPIKSSEAIADAVDYLLSNNQTRITMVYNAIAISKKFSREGMYESFIKGVKNYESTL